LYEGKKLRQKERKVNKREREIRYFERRRRENEPLDSEGGDVE
jgi:hypothetical protein